MFPQVCEKVCEGLCILIVQKHMFSQWFPQVYEKGCEDYCHADGALLGQSATQLFSYEVFLWRTPMILTTNNWDLSTLADDEKEWVTANCVAVRVDTPVFAAARAGVPASPQPHPAARRPRKRPAPLPKARPPLKRKRGSEDAAFEG